MGKYKTYMVNIVLEEGSALENRIRKSAEDRGVSFQDALEEVVNIGLWGHIQRNVALVERCAGS